jgi:hypothetical protein
MSRSQMEGDEDAATAGPLKTIQNNSKQFKTITFASPQEGDEDAAPAGPLTASPFGTFFRRPLSPSPEMFPSTFALATSPRPSSAFPQPQPQQRAPLPLHHPPRQHHQHHHHHHPSQAQPSQQPPTAAEWAAGNKVRRCKSREP